MNISQMKAAEPGGCCALILLLESDQNSHSHRNPADHWMTKKREKLEGTVNGDRVSFCSDDKLI